MRRPTRRGPVGLLLISSFAVAIGTAAVVGTQGAPAPAPAAARGVLAAAPAIGCGVPFPPGSSALSFTGAGRPKRTLVVHVPTGYTGATRVPLVLNLHGSGSTAVRQELLSGMDSLADADGFIVVYPQALIPTGSGFDWNIPGEPRPSGTPHLGPPPNDITFLSRLVVALEARYCVNTARVYVTGFSGGARMASQLACDDANLFAAVAPVSGLRLPTSCPAVRAVPVLAFHGTADPIDPYRGHGQGYWTYSVPEATQLWASQDSCSLRSRVSRPAAGVTLTHYGRCANDATVDLYTIEGEGQEWPGGPTLPTAVTGVLGPQSNAINANQLMWAFFSAHKL